MAPAEHVDQQATLAARVRGSRYRAYARSPRRCPQGTAAGTAVRGRARELRLVRPVVFPRANAEVCGGRPSVIDMDAAPERGNLERAADRLLLPTFLVASSWKCHHLLGLTLQLPAAKTNKREAVHSAVLIHYITTSYLKKAFLR